MQSVLFPFLLSKTKNTLHPLHRASSRGGAAVSKTTESNERPLQTETRTSISKRVTTSQSPYSTVERLQSAQYIPEVRAQRGHPRLLEPRLAKASPSTLHVHSLPWPLSSTASHTVGGWSRVTEARQSQLIHRKTPHDSMSALQPHVFPHATRTHLT